MYMKLQTSDSSPSGPAHWFKRMGIAGFTFFLVKGLLWLLIPWLAHSALG